jgi:hypothetical protein
MRPENKRMQEFLRRAGINCTPKYLATGSLKHTWRLYGKAQWWTGELCNALTELGFLDYNNQPLHQFSGNGGVFSVFVRGHYELLEA